jgi:leader peptidase (prepilin peptidase)/N-methyltransferase
VLDPLGPALGLAAIGWLLGLPIAFIARWFRAGRAGHAAAREARLLAIDPLLQGFQAVVLGILAWRFGPTIQLAVYGALSLVLTLVLFIDLRTRFVYSIVAYPGIVAGIILSPIAGGAVAWDGLASALLGAAALGAVYIVGRVLYRGAEPLARGDVIIGGLVGSVVGLGRLFPAIFYGIVLSSLLALVFVARFRTVKMYFPYGPGLCLGALVALLR